MVDLFMMHLNKRSLEFLELINVLLYFRKIIFMVTIIWNLRSSPFRRKSCNIYDIHTLESLTWYLPLMCFNFIIIMVLIISYFMQIGSRFHWWIQTILSNLTTSYWWDKSVASLTQCAYYSNYHPYLWYIKFLGN